jgi:peptidoglycan/xylan/chitin deacetylase (PgdA/CDA1 family)
MSPALQVVMYHYIRDLPNTPFPRIKGMLLSDFQKQVKALCASYEMATLESTLAFLRGAYVPRRDLCLLTFDDGLKEHYTDVTPLLAEAGVQGIFFPITECLEDGTVASVHMNHFLMASLDFATYQGAFLQRLQTLAPVNDKSREVEPAIAQRTYPRDSPAVASFKYLFNFVLNGEIRDRVVKTLFEEHLADERSFSQSLYLSWEEARQMQAVGMLIGGHSHRHRPLAGLGEEELDRDLTTCRRFLRERLQPQSLWPFCYPYGKKESFGDAAVRQLKRLEFTCSFSTESGMNHSGMDMFALRRLDCKDASMN